LTELRWGFRPAWLKSPKGPPPINARAETLLERPMFRGSVARGRCSLPADGFYEWASPPGQKTKQPMHMRLKGGGLFGFAGLHTQDADGEPTRVIITTAANELLASFHVRMPVILEPEYESLWLEPSVTEPEAVLPCLSAFPAERMGAYPVSPLVSSPRNEMARS
jgi:putative SOS response-associated peptidase YedK